MVAQVVEELKTVTYTTFPMEERSKKPQKKSPRRRNVADQVAEALQTVTYSTLPPMGESTTNLSLCFPLLLLLILNGVQGGVIGAQPLRLSVGLQLSTSRQVFLQAAFLLLLGFSQHSIQIWTQQTNQSTRIGTLKLHILPTQHPDLDTANKPVN